MFGNMFAPGGHLAQLWQRWVIALGWGPETAMVRGCGTNIHTIPLATPPLNSPSALKISWTQFIYSNTIIIGIILSTIITFSDFHLWSIFPYCVLLDFYMHHDPNLIGNAIWQHWMQSLEVCLHLEALHSCDRDEWQLWAWDQRPPLCVGVVLTFIPSFLLPPHLWMACMSALTKINWTQFVYSNTIQHFQLGTDYPARRNPVEHSTEICSTNEKLKKWWWYSKWCQW